MQTEELANLDRFLVIVINYNQEPEITAFLKQLMHFWPIQRTLVVDDGSTDNSPKLASSFGYSVLYHSNNRGVGAAIRSGIHFAKENKYDSVVIMSSNGKMRPADLSCILEPIRMGKANYVTGSRFASNGKSPGLTKFRRVSIPIFSFLMSLLLRKRFTDITCGFRAYNIDFLESSNLDLNQSWLDRYEMEYYIHYWACRLGQKITEVPVSICYDHLASGRISKIPPLLGWWSMIRPILFLTLGLKK
jgi:dolichol-phosphate mannosyltransferase